MYSDCYWASMRSCINLRGAATRTPYGPTTPSRSPLSSDKHEPGSIPPGLTLRIMDLYPQPAPGDTPQR